MNWKYWFDIWAVAFFAFLAGLNIIAGNYILALIIIYIIITKMTGSSDSVNYTKVTKQ